MEEITAQPTYLDVTIEARGSFYFDMDPGDTLFIYIIYGSVLLPAENNRTLPSRQAFKDIDEGTFIKEHHSDGTISSKKVNNSFYN